MNAMRQSCIPFLLSGALVVCVALTARGQWVQTNGPGGLSVGSLVVHNNAVCAGTFEQGVFRSTDVGAHWSAVSDFGLSQAVTECGVVLGNRMIFGTDDGIFVSQDDGATWTSIDVSNQKVFAVAIAGSVWLAGTPYGVMRSPDGGSSWDVGSQPILNGAVEGLWVFGNRVFATLSNGSNMVSLDAGDTWVEYLPLTGHLITQMIEWKNAIYVATLGAGVIRSVDGGSTWVAYNPQLPTKNVSSLVPIGDALYIGTDNGVFTLAPGTDSWISTSYALTNPRVLSLAAIGQTLVAGVDGGGVFTSFDGAGTWIHSDAGFPYPRIYDIAGYNGQLVSAQSNGMSRTVNGGELWTAFDGTGKWEQCSAKSVYTFARSSTELYAGAGCAVYRATTNDISDWAVASNTTWSGEPYHMILYGTRLIMGGHQTGIRYSDDHGGAFTSATIDNIYAYTTNAFGASSNALYAAMEDDVYESTDHGAHWHAMYASSNPVTALAVEAGGTVYCATDVGVRRWSNSYWKTINDGLPGTNIATLFSDGTTLFAGMASGAIYATTDKGMSWKSIGSTFLTATPTSMCTLNDTLFVATDGMGVWKHALRGITGVSESAQPFSHILVHAYPNPAAGRCTLEYSIPAGEWATIRIVNMRGEVVHTVSSKAGTPEMRTQSVDVSSFPPGPYLCEVITRGASAYTIIQKMR